eukprot:TRINITY_DN48486_c0_g1_i1.p1 TRINITY_DN48486_c0_g1~~TRINITY_DN48486_c0_g1_i1.p1  ORF type:complete len:510 (+),score=81.64 TRINITY_DN48486_c0_g1_i1:47-1531(+)
MVNDMAPSIMSDAVRGMPLAFSVACHGSLRPRADSSLAKQQSLRRTQKEHDGYAKAEHGASFSMGAALLGAEVFRSTRKRSARRSVATCATATQSPATVKQDLTFTPGQRVIIMDAKAGQQGEIVSSTGGFAARNLDVRLTDGSICNVSTVDIQNASACKPSTPTAAAQIASAVAPTDATDELQFQPGQRVTILGPPALAGKQGDIVGPGPNDAFAVRLDSGSVFNILENELKDASLSTSPTAVTEPIATESCPPTYWAPASYFGWDQLVSKGPRGDADKGSPCCSSRVLFKGAASSVGAWTCTEGGFPVVNRPTTETFYVLEGEGFITDADGTPHCFHSGDLVVLPKGWSGRWDILKPIRKIWAVHNHAENLSSEDSRTAVVGPLDGFSMPAMKALGKRSADWGEPEHFTKQLWQAGPTKVGAWACTAGGFLGTSNRPTTEFFYVLEGLCFLTGEDGVARRVTAGDTVVLPKGWSGRWDIIQPIRKVWCVISE